MTDDIDDAIDEVVEEPEEPDSEAEEGGDSDGESGFLDGLLDMSGSNKSLESYEDSPYRSIASGTTDLDGEELQERGELHIARGIDGLLGGIVEAGHPIVDLGIGAVLITLSGGESSDGEFGEEHLDDTPAGDYLTGDDDE